MFRALRAADGVRDRTLKIRTRLQRAVGSQKVPVVVESLRGAGLETTSRKYGQVGSKPIKLASGEILNDRQQDVTDRSLTEREA